MRVSKGTLERSLAVLQADLEERIHEGFWARVRRYFTDRDLRDRLALAKSAKAALEQTR